MRVCDVLYDVVDGLADDLFHPLCVLLSHPLQSDAEGRLFGAAVVSEQQDISTCQYETNGWGLWEIFFLFHNKTANTV